MKTSALKYTFAAPVVVGADPVDGLLQTTDLDRPVPVNIEVWNGVEPGYFMQLKLNGELVGDIYTFNESDIPSDFVTLTLSEKLLDHDGVYDLAFSATGHHSLVTIDSPSIYFKVDRSTPGAALLSPIIFPEVTLGDNLAGQIPSYAGMQEGDLIQTVCNGVPGPVHSVVADELSHQPVNIIFERSFLQDLGRETVLIEYFVTDRAGNISIMSLPVYLTLQV
ncbi:MAG TPA: hypothetical protein VGC62_18545 [Pseudomonas sp.]|uniref:hypothetical protein n=1 Tax=Pseudomonas sp. TaxID=306 RepID=UPI002ED8BDD9